MVYDSGSFPSRPAALIDISPPNQTISAPSEIVVLSNITDVRVCSTWRLAASALVVVPRRWTLRRRYTGVGVSFALDDPDSNVTWRIMKLDAGSIEWQLVVGSNLS